MHLWTVEWLITSSTGTRTIPALKFLREQPPAVRIQLLAIVDAVRTVGPDHWRDRTSHTSMRGNLAHLHEARDRHGDTLYRLFLLWQRQHHRVIVIDGRVKANATRLPTAEYEAVSELAATVDQDPHPSRRSTTPSDCSSPSSAPLAKSLPAVTSAATRPTAICRRPYVRPSPRDPHLLDLRLAGRP